MLGADLDAQNILSVEVNSSTGKIFIEVTDYSSPMQLGVAGSSAYVDAMFAVAISAKLEGQSNVWLSYTVSNGQAIVNSIAFGSR